VGAESRQKIELLAPEGMSQAVNQNGMKTRVAEQNFEHTAHSRIPIEYNLDILFDGVEHDSYSQSYAKGFDPAAKSLLICSRTGSKNNIPEQSCQLFSRGTYSRKKAQRQVVKMEKSLQKQVISFVPGLLDITVSQVVQKMFKGLILTFGDLQTDQNPAKVTTLSTIMK